MPKPPRLTEIDIPGLADDMDQFVKDALPLWKRPRMEQAIRLLHRNPGLAPAVEKFILSQEGAVTLAEPLNWNPPVPAHEAAA